MKGVAMLEGGSVSGQFDLARLTYNYIAALLAPFVGLFVAFEIINLTCWGVAAALSWRLARSLTGSDAAGTLSAVLTVTGMGWAVHVSDYAAHILSSVLYFGGVIAIYESEVWKRRRRLTVHLAIGTYLAIVSLAYNTGIMLVSLYALFAWRRNRWFDLLVAMAIALTAQPIWVRVMDLLATSPAAIWEASVLQVSFAKWMAELLLSPMTLIGTILRDLADYVTIDSPLILPLGFLGILIAPQLRGRRWFLIASILIPVAALMPFRMRTVGSAAYSIFGITPILHAALAAVLVAMARGRTRWIAVAAGAALVGVQGFWSTASLWGWQAPLHAYFFGPFEMGDAWTTRLHIMSMTGGEPTPALLGGDASLVEAGMANQPAPYISTSLNPLYSLIAKALPTAYGVATIMILLPRNRVRRVAIGGLVGLAVASALIAPLTNPVPPPLDVDIWSTFRQAPASPLRYTVRLSPTFVNALAGLPEDGAVILFIGTAAGENHVDLASGGRPIPVTELDSAPDWGQQLTVDRAALLDRIASEPTIEVTITPVREVTMRGWQRSDLTGRSMTPEGPVLPIVELRGTAHDGSLLLAGF